MQRHPSPAYAASLAVALLVGAALLAPGPARARIGNPLKKAKEAAEKEAKKATGNETQAPASEDKPLVFDDVTLELTDARLGGIVSAYQKADQIAAPRAGLVDKRNKAALEQSQIAEKYNDKISALRQKRDDVQGCIEHGYSVARDRRAQEYTQRVMSDPKLYEKFKNIAAENNAAAAKGDSAAIARAQKGLEEEMLPTHDDSLQVQKECGVPPPITPEEKRLAELDKQIQDIDAQIQKIDNQVAESQSKASGMNPQQWGVALERIQMFDASAGKGGSNGGGGGKKKKGDSSGDSGSSSSSDSGSGSGSGSGESGSSTMSSTHKGYTEVEVKAIEKYREPLKKYLGMN